MRALTDTSGMIALLDRSDKHHQDVVKLLQTIEFVVPISVLPEVDYMVTKYLGEQVSRVFLEDISNQKFSYLTLDNMDIKQTAKFMKMYADIPIGFVDASLAALAD
ncbi:MAG: PIN domain-containing protein [Cyanobacteria bacterium LVE1205-1]|jgi:predicted nucleic acid-binding protein